MKPWMPIHGASDDSDLVRHVGYDLLGPVVQRWLLALHQHLLLADDDSTIALFCARAGLRIAELHEIFAGKRGRRGPPAEVFWISRLATVKGVFGRPGGRKRSIDILTREYFHVPLRDLVCGLMRHRPDLLNGLNLKDRTLEAHGHNLPGWLTVDAPVQRALLAFLEESSDAFNAEIERLLSGRRRAILIDSGWQGTAQSLLSATYPDTSWQGLYFGRILSEMHDPGIVPDCIGLMFEAERYDPRRPETAFVRHRHLIEELLEPDAPSVEDVRHGPASKAVKRTIDACNTARPTPESDALYLQVRQYVADHAGQSLAEILAAHGAAMPELARMILNPRREEVRILAANPRSADLGKSALVPVVTDPGRAEPEKREDRIGQALWPEGQIALEYPSGTARHLQDLINGRSGKSGCFDPSSGKASLPAKASPKPRVAIVTRTKDRPLLFRRAADSVACQKFADFCWIVVNDGGDAEEVVRLMRGTFIDPRRMRLVSHDESQGMEAASNAGIAACESDYVVIHDDDDSWAPEFLERTVAFLDSPEGARYGGVVTHSVYVSEEVRGDRIIRHDSRPYNAWVRNVQLSEMACGNFFPPIAFVFRRSVWDRVGGFDESLPVLGDWFFNMELLLEDDIAVLPEPLAFYHHRDRGEGGQGRYANSVIGGISKHEEYAAVVRNAFLRRHGDRAGIAACFALGYAVNDLRGRIERQSRSLETPKARTHRGTDDRLWCVAEHNAALAESPWWRRLAGTAVASPETDWQELREKLRRAGHRLRAPADFDEPAYLRNNPDVEDAVRIGKLPSGYQHYVLHGMTEGRPRPVRR